MINCTFCLITQNYMDSVNSQDKFKFVNIDQPEQNFYQLHIWTGDCDDLSSKYFKYEIKNRNKKWTK